MKHRVTWTLAIVVALATGYYVYAGHMNSVLLYSDPDVIPANPRLMHYAIARGRATYRSYCLDCHGKQGSGNPSNGIPVLSDADWLYGTGLVSDIERIVTYGIRSNNPKAWNLAVMPAFGRPHPSQSNASISPLSPEEIRDVIAFLMQNQHRPADAGAAERGARVYQTTGGCYDCHAPDAQGDSAIGAPNLVDTVTLYGRGDRDAMFDSIANGRQGVCPSWNGALSPVSIREVSLYVYELSHSAHSE